MSMRTRIRQIYFAVPVGSPGVCFNAHRIHTPQQILGYFPRLTLFEFSGVDGQGNFVQNANLAQFESVRDGTGFFRFTKLPLGQK